MPPSSHGSAPLSLGEVARRVEGRVVGDPELSICGISTLSEAGPGDIAFLTNPKYLTAAATTRASAILLSGGADRVSRLQSSPNTDRHIDRVSKVLVPNPYYALSQLIPYFYPPHRSAVGIDPRASLSEGIVLGQDVSVGPLAVIEARVVLRDRVQIGAGAFIGEGSIIGEDTLVHPHVTVLHNVQVGKRVVLHSGSVLGSDGFGFAQHEGGYHKIAQVGGVIIEDDVEVGANVTIDRATFGNTTIGRGTKIDNLVHIAHNVHIGSHVILVAQTGISGSATLGDRVTLAGQVGVVGHVTVGAGATVAARSVVTKDIDPGTKVAGFPAVPHKTWTKAQALFARLPVMRERITALEEKIANLTQET